MTVPESSSGADLRCAQCGRILRPGHRPSDPNPEVSGNEETRIYNAGKDRENVDDTSIGTPLPGDQKAVPEKETPDQDATRVESPRKTRLIAPQQEDSFQTRAFDPGDGMKEDEHDFVYVAPEDEETKIGSRSDVRSSASGPRSRDSSRGSAVDLSERVMGAISRSTIPLVGTDDLGTYGIHRVLRTHQKGGMGRILIAYDQYLKRDIALKELHPEVAEDDSIVRRFIGEAEITAQLEHPGIVPIHTLGLDRGGNPYYTMKLIKGHTFQDAIKAYHRNPGKQELLNLVRRLVSICKTMAFAHNKGVIHRDLKPANIMLGEHGETLVMDWGLAKPFNQLNEEGSFTSVPIEHRADPRPELTMVGAIVGTPAFMSPEQAMPEDYVVGPLSDIFSLGTILYYLLAGQTAFSGRSTQEVLKKVRAATPPKPSEIKPNVPPGLEAICLKAMARNTEDRYQTATELVDDLCRWLDGEPVLAKKETFFQRVRRWVDHHRILSISIPLVLILIVVLTNVGIHLDRNRRETNARAVIRSILEDPVDLTDQVLVAVDGSPGLIIRRDPRQTGGTMISCVVEAVPRSEHGSIAIAAPAGHFWDLGNRRALTFTMFENHAKKNISLSNFFIRLGRGSSYFEYRPAEEYWTKRKRSNWIPFTIPLSDPSPNWSRTETEFSPPSIHHVEWIEIHFDLDESLTLYIDHVSFE